MLAFIVRRLMQAAGVMITVAFIAFMLFQYVGDPVVFLLGQDATPEQIHALRSALGLDRSFVVQVWDFLVRGAGGGIGSEPARGGQGLAPARRASAGHAGADLGECTVGPGVRDSDGGVRGPAARQL